MALAKNQHTDQFTRRMDPEVKSHDIATCCLAKGKKQSKQTSKKLNVLEKRHPLQQMALGETGFNL